MTNGKPVRLSTIIAPNWHEVHEAELVGLKERIEVQRHKLRDTEEANVPKVPAKVHTPNTEEYNRHCPTHLLYRSWCLVFVQAKTRTPPPFLLLVRAVHR